jgi:hypothetical protein
MMTDGLDDSNDFCNSFSFSLLDGVLVALALGMAWHGWSGYWLRGIFVSLCFFVMRVFELRQLYSLSNFCLNGIQYDALVPLV